MEAAVAGIEKQEFVSPRIRDGQTMHPELMFQFRNKLMRPLANR